MTHDEDLQRRAQELRLWGLLARWNEVALEPWVKTMLDWEEEERQRRSLERRFAQAKLGDFKPMADFDWSWPESADRALIEDLFTMQFLEEAANVVLVGPNGVGKTMIGLNLAHQALLRGHSVRCTSASEMLGELAAQDGATALGRCLARYTSPHVLFVDEVGYLSYGNRHADLLFEVVTRRYKKHATILTTNRPFKEWSEVFPNAACVVTLVDRLLHKAEVVKIAGKSYRAKEAQERAETKARNRNKAKKNSPPPEES